MDHDAQNAAIASTLMLAAAQAGQVGGLISGIELTLKDRGLATSVLALFESFSATYGDLGSHRAGRDEVHGIIASMREVLGNG